MTVLNSSATPGTAPRRRRIGLWLGLLLGGLGSIAGATWWFTEPLADRPVQTPPLIDEQPLATAEATPPGALASWPDTRLEGDEAKSLLLAMAVRSVEELNRIPAYTATFQKHERIGGTLGPVQTLAMKVRNHPFAIYLKFLAPKEGKEVLYAEGHHDNKVIAHSGDWTRRLIPRLAVAVDSPLALADSRHPVTEAGLLALANKLVHYRKMDIGDPLAITVIDRTTAPDGKPALRSIHVHSDRNAGRPFPRVEILYDPETRFPIRIDSYDWPAPNHVGPLDLAESFYYTDINFNAPLNDATFDPKNPDYAFMRF